MAPGKIVQSPKFHPGGGQRVDLQQGWPLLSSSTEGSRRPPSSPGHNASEGHGDVRYHLDLNSVQRILGQFAQLCHPLDHVLHAQRVVGALLPLAVVCIQPASGQSPIPCCQPPWSSAFFFFFFFESGLSSPKPLWPYFGLPQVTITVSLCCSAF